MRRLRVLYLSPTGNLGGAEVSLLDLLAAIRASQPTWDLHLVIGTAGPLAAQAAAVGLPVTVLPFPPLLARLGEAGAGRSSMRVARVLLGMALAAPAAFAYRRRLQRVIESFRPDVVHSNGQKMHILAACCGGSTAVVWHLHEYVGPRPITSRLLKRLAVRCRLAIANSSSVADDARSALGPTLRVQVLHNAVNLERFAPAGQTVDLDRLCGLPAAAPGTVRVGLVASLARWKGHAIFLEAMALLRSRAPLRGYVIGQSIYQTDGSQYSLAELRNLAARLGVTATVGFTGFVERPDAAFRALDIVVHASTEPEPFGLVIAEAMACGRPVVVSAAGGAAEIVDTGVDALTYPPGNAAALADRILQLARDSALRARLGHAGRATAERRYDRARLAAQLIPSYHGTVE